MGKFSGGIFLQLIITVISFTSFNQKLIAQGCNNINPQKIVNQITYFKDNVGFKEQIKEFSKINNALEKCVNTPDSLKSLVYHRLGAAYNNDDQLEKALEFSKKALEIRQKDTRKILPQAQTLYNLGIIEDKRGDYSASIEYFKKAAILYENLNNDFEVNCLSKISELYKEIGDFAKAEIFAWKSINKTTIDEEKLALAYTNYAVLVKNKRDYKKSILYSYKADSLFRESVVDFKTNANYIVNLINLSNSYRDIKNYTEAIKVLQVGISSTTNAAMINELKGRIAIVMVKKGDLGSASQYYFSSAKLLATYKDYFYQRAIIANRLGLYRESIRFADLAESELLLKGKLNLKDCPDKNTLFELLTFKINSNNLLKLNQDNLINFFKADSLIDLMRQEHTEQGSKLFWREKTHTFYENAIETCYQLKDYNKAFYFMEKSRAILLLDGLKDLDAKKILSADKQNQEQNLRYKIIGLQKKLGNMHETDKNYTKIYQQLLNTKEEYNSFVKSLEKTNSAYYQLKYNNQYISLSSLQAALKLSNQSFIEYFVGENTVYAFVATAKDARLIKINLQKYNSLSKQFLSLTAQKPPHTATQLNNFCLVANKLYQLIYAPLNIPVGRVIISQDNYFLPFGALVADVERQKFLVEDYAFSYTYSANILFREKEKQLSFNKNLLGFSPIHYNNSLKLNTLSGSDQVLNSIEDKYFSGKVFLEKQATKQNFIQNAPNYTIIQLFTHGKADTVSDKSKIYFYDDAINMSELYQLEKLKAELVVLSACETNLGSNATGEGIMSFARGFAYLGVPSTVSTLWSVNNQSTYQLIESFYKYLADGYEKDIALQMAQKDYIKKSGYKFPYYWSGLVLVGDSNKMTEFDIISMLLILTVIVSLLIFIRKTSFCETGVWPL